MTMQEMKTIHKCASALYLVGDLNQAWIYLDALVENGTITNAQSFEIMDKVIASDENFTYGEIQELRAKF